MHSWLSTWNFTIECIYFIYLILGSWISVILSDPFFPTHCCLIWFQRRSPAWIKLFCQRRMKTKNLCIHITANLPWLTNSGGPVWLPPLLWGSEGLFDIPIDEMLLCEWASLGSNSKVLLLQKPSDLSILVPVCSWALSPLEASSIEIISGVLLQHPKQSMLCYKAG